jgi:BirA family transcriptional regulator, biotin operon repressor / biotin---[acetyl-CoA-carboxylase] ligase
MLAATTRFGDIRELEEVDSTNRYLLDLAGAGAPEGVVVVADYQSAGRGRRDRTWEAPPGGGLLASVLLRPDPVAVPPDRRWLVTAAVALAAADACGHNAAIKWPNDLLLGGRKLAGILAEADAGAIVVGIGVNVSWAPLGAASLGPAVDRGSLLAALLVNLERQCRDWAAVAAVYRARCATVGRLVRLELPGRTMTGRALEVSADGRLRVSAGDEILDVSVADVIHVTEP